jgi:chemotaxis protein methyltransferase CheR
MAELGIVDIREINQVIKSNYDYDFSNHALTSYKQRLERIMRIYLIGSTEGMIRKLQDDRGFFDTFLHEVSVPSTEMFRDPSLWRWLREEYFQNYLDKNTAKFKIWLPSCVSGAELYSLAIMLSEMDLMDKVQITASSISQKSINIIKEGIYDLKKLEVSQENYKRYNGTRDDLSFYHKTEKDYLIRNTSLIGTVDFKKLNINFDDAPQNVRLILFRNNLIYYNPTRQEAVLQILYRALSVSGHMVLGIRERISGLSSSRDFDLVNETESVYRKKI